MTAASTRSSDQQAASDSDIVSALVDRRGVIDRAVYGTIVVTSVLVVYDGWAHLRVLGAVAVILGPVVAMVIGDVFAATLAAYAELGRRRAERELLTIVRTESRFLARVRAANRPSFRAEAGRSEPGRIGSCGHLDERRVARLLGWRRGPARRPWRSRDRARRDSGTRGGRCGVAVRCSSSQERHSPTVLPRSSSRKTGWNAL